MDLILNNVALIAVTAGLFIMCLVIVVDFTRKPKAEQIEKVRKWLLWAVTEAEKELGAGTGQLKLHTVYDLFVQRFPSLALMVSFEWFSELVDEALVEMRELLEKNEAIRNVVIPEVEN